MDRNEETAELFKALAHPVRLQILAILRGGEECVCHMEATLRLRQAYISQHLAVLREAGLVSVRREGWNVYYQATRPEVFKALDAAADAVSGGKSKNEVPRDSRSRDCPCPKCSFARSARPGTTRVALNRS